METFLVRDATEHDIPSIARLHVNTWNATYAPLLSRGPSCAIRGWRDLTALAGPPQ